jgi:hypothetical protein
LVSWFINSRSQRCTSSTMSLSRNVSEGFVIACPGASLRSVNIRRHRSPTRGIIAVFSGKNLLDFRRTRRLTFPRLRRARKLDPKFRVFVSHELSMTCPGFPATNPATAGIPSLFGRNRTSRVERVSGERKSIPLPQRVFSFDSQRVTHDAHSQPSREPERSCLGGRSLCMGGAASQRCEGRSGKAATGRSVTIT